MIYARYQSKTARRQWRQKVRNALGTSMDSAPSALHVLRAADSMAALIDAATNGRFRMRIVDMNGNTITAYEALRQAQTEGIYDD